MQSEETFVCLGTDWSQPDQPALRLGRLGSAQASFLLPLQGAVRFRVISPVRYCAGWFDLKGQAPRHVNCRTWEAVTTAKQCRRCQQLEGFTGAHQAHRRPERLPENIRQYLMQPHYLYVAVFADGSTKVGTVAQARLETRLAEQGAVAAVYLARASDGLLIRQAEEAVSAQLSLKQGLATKRKLEALLEIVQVVQLRDRLAAFMQHVGPVIDGLSSAERLPQPRWWTPSASAQAAFAATPVSLYQASFGEGDHSLYMRGATGSIGVFNIRSEPGSSVLAADLSGMRGRELDFGDYSSPGQEVQTALF